MRASKSIRASAIARWRALLLACLIAGATSTVAGAHGFGQRYELPLPLGLYLFGAAAVVALSFVVFGLFVRGAPHRASQLELRTWALGRTIGRPVLLPTLQLIVLLLFIVAILAGLFGNQNPYRNITPTLVWIIWWVGFALVAAFVGDFWSAANPWRTLFDAAHWLWLRSGRTRAFGLGLPYPQWLGVWPACLLLLIFCWVELVYPHSASPAHIASMILAYSALTLTGMFVFGRDSWLRHGEVFSLVFGTLGLFAPIAWNDRRLVLRPFGAGLIVSPPVSTSMVAFVLLLLATVLYDGLIGTGEWALLESAVRIWLPQADSLAVRTAGLVAFWLVFLATYFATCMLMSAVASGRFSASEVARGFVLTLVPIAIGYHVAHYLVFLLIQGQYIIPLLSDPFGRGWNILGTAGYRVDIGLAGARFAWYAALAAIVAGHVFAVYLAHLRAAAVFRPARIALATQIPLTAIMVVYTFVGLSITAEPIVESRVVGPPATVASEFVAIPADAVLPDAQDGALRVLGPGKSARTKLTYKVLGSAFHDGSKTGTADLLYGYAFAYRWSGDRVHYDSYVDAATGSLRRHLLGVRVVGVDAARSFSVGDVNFVRETFTVEIYLAVAPEEPEWSAIFAPPWSTLPWTVLALMEEAVTRGWAAFSQSEAERRGVPWLDLIRSPDLNSRLAALVTQFEREGFRPAGLRAHVSEDEARRRWAALAAFHRIHGHFLVTNGPYKLKAWSPQSITLEAFRDLSYPLGVGSYDAYAVPRRGFVTKADWNGKSVILAGDIEVMETFQRSYRLVRTPLRSVPAPVLKRAAPECRYVVLDANGRVAAAGGALPGADTNFRIDLSDLRPGHYTLSALIAVNGNVMNSDLHRMAIAVP